MELAPHKARSREDLLVLGADLVLEIGEILPARLAVDEGHDRGREVEHLLELARGDVEEVADPLEGPDPAGLARLRMPITIAARA